MSQVPLYQIIKYTRFNGESFYRIQELNELKPMKFFSFEAAEERVLTLLERKRKVSNEFKIKTIEKLREYYL